MKIRTNTAIVTPEVLEALADIQRFEPSSYKEDTEVLTDFLLEFIDNAGTEEKKKQTITLIQDFRYYSSIIQRLYPQNHPGYSESERLSNP